MPLVAEILVPLVAASSAASRRRTSAARRRLLVQLTRSASRLIQVPLVVASRCTKMSRNNQNIFFKRAWKRHNKKISLVLLPKTPPPYWYVYCILYLNHTPAYWQITKKRLAFPLSGPCKCHNMIKI